MYMRHEPVPLTNRFHLAVYDNAYIISRRGKNEEVRKERDRCTFLSCFDVLCALSEHTHKWYPFILYIVFYRLKLEIKKKSSS